MTTFEYILGGFMICVVQVVIIILAHHRGWTKGYEQAQRDARR